MLWVPLLQNVVPRVSAKLDVATISDITEVKSRDASVGIVRAGKPLVVVNAVSGANNNENIKGRETDHVRVLYAARSFSLTLRKTQILWKLSNIIERLCSLVNYTSAWITCGSSDRLLNYILPLCFWSWLYSTMCILHRMNQILNICTLTVWAYSTCQRSVCHAHIVYSVNSDNKISHAALLFVTC